MIDLECPSREALQAFAVGQLGEFDSDELSVHVSRCGKCQAAMHTLDDAGDTLVGRLRTGGEDDSFAGEAECDSAVRRILEAGPAGAPESGSAGSVGGQSLVGEELGEYRLLAPLGHGGMGTVYKALHTKLDRVVAIKLLPRGRLDDERAQARFEREMRAIGKLDHPHIVKAFDAREIDRTRLLCMEYVEGADLGEVSRRLGPLGIADACELARRAALALECARQHGLVHRDVKPSNIMLSRDGETKLLDLGLARFQQVADDDIEVTGTGQTMGTADYVAPEQVVDGRQADIRSDIYSLGCTVYKLLAGRAPFETPECGGVFDKLTSHVSRRPTALRTLAPAVPERLAAVVDKMLSKEATARPATPGEVATLLAPFCGGHDLTALAERALATEPAPRPVTRPVVAASAGWWTPRVSWPTALLLAAGASAAAFALGVIITIRHPDGRRTQVEVPTGSQSKVDAQGNVEVQLPGAPGPGGMMAPMGGTIPSMEGGGMIMPGAGGMPSGAGSMGDFGGGLIPQADGAPMSGGGESPYRGGPPGMLPGIPPGMVGGAAMGAGPAPIAAVAGEGPMGGGGGLAPAAMAPAPLDPGAAQVPTGFTPAEAYQESGGLLSGLFGAREAARKAQSANNLKQLALAMHMHADTYKSFPPAYSVSPDGKPLLSWRVHLLPYLEQAELYQQFHLDEPWDSEHNRPLIEQMPQVFRAPSRPADTTSSDYYGLVGPNTIFSSVKGCQFREIQDGTSNTVMFVEATLNEPWTKPMDIQVAPETLAGLGAFVSGFHIAMCDGSVRFIERNKLTIEEFLAMASKDGGERIPPR